MGIVSSIPDEHPTLYIKNPDRFQITEIVVSNSAHDPYITFPALSNRIAAIPQTIDLLEFTQDPELQSISPNKFLLKLLKDKNFKLKFKFRVGGNSTNTEELKGLTFINAANEKELARILTVEFNVDPNLHRHANVALLGDFTPKSEDIEWTWKWVPPSLMDEAHHGWRNHCCFAEYNKKEHTFQVLGSFTFWVAASSSSSPVQFLPSSSSDPNLPPPTINISAASSSISSVGVGGRRMSDDSNQHEPEDGPLFRATLSEYEKKTGSLKHHVKRVLKTAAGSHEAILYSHKADEDFLNALRAAAVAHPQAFQPLLDNYFEEASKKISTFKENMAHQMQSLLLEPVRRLYENDVKVADTKKKEFEEESRDYYQFLSKYLSLKVDSAKEKKKLESDSKYQNKRKTFELKRFDYYAYMQDLHGGRKDQEILYHLTNFAEKQYVCYQQTAANIQYLKPGLDKVAAAVAEAAKEINLMRKEREERRRTLETRALAVNPFPTEPFNEGDSTNQSIGSTSTGDAASDDYSASTVGSPITAQNRFKGIRDMEHHDTENALLAGRKKEGFLFATSRVTHHGAVDQLTLTNWHKYWCVLAGGQLCEYSNWKKQLETHNEPINLRFATVREARGIDRRFCFEVITPQYRRIYQATSAEDMNSWVTVISNAIESLLNGTSSCRNLGQLLAQEDHNLRSGDSVKKPLKRTGTLTSLTDKKRFEQRKTRSLAAKPDDTHLSNHRIPQDGGNGGADPAIITGKIIDIIKNADSSNSICADCGARKTEWCSINLGVILCIECSGIHRSLGTHISKVRSLTLDTISYTPDLIEQIKMLGNARSNAIWEAKLLAEVKSSSAETRQNSSDNKLNSSQMNSIIPPDQSSSTPPKADAAPLPPPKVDDKSLLGTSPDADWVDIINMINPSSSSITTISPSTKKLPPVPKPSSSDSRAIKQKFIIAKYVERAYVDFSQVDEDRTATDLLFEAVKNNDVPGAMQAIALRADVNAARRFEVENDHGLKTPLLLALLHIKNPTYSEKGTKQLFPMAELLLQNGALVERTLVDELEDILSSSSSKNLSRSASTKSAGAWAAEVVGDLKRNGRTILEIVYASGNEAAVKYLLPKAVARGTSSPTPGHNENGSTQTTSTGGVVGGTALEKKTTQNLGRSLSMSVRNALT
ncbi:13175_t:CDS:2 [Ambispora leptoticha]|uniref:13175_t:CDS:1 n=1 Tax=Ambispora leptoticha TaxID=144679 RepID=A0A9N8ZL14_9GLOM|nr:13175_t:CDS:2 [Ambispora leptoticha]